MRVKITFKSDVLGSLMGRNKWNLVFQKDQNGNPCIQENQIKGFFKEQQRNAKSKKSKSRLSKESEREFAKWIDGQVFVRPRNVPIDVNGELFTKKCLTSWGNPNYYLKTIKCNCEAAPAESSITFDIIALDKSIIPYVVECLNQGMMDGFGTGRSKTNKRNGKFVWEEVKE